jgi:hypothetical protein
VPLPVRPLEVCWRAGVDLNPLDVSDDDATVWLATLVWPEHEERRRRLAAAVEVARAEPPRLVRADLLDALPGLVEEAAGHGTAVVFHSAVAAYLDKEDRRRFADLMGGLVAERRCHWVSNEGPGVVPGLESAQPGLPGRFALALDGRQLAWAHGHGQWLRWL